MACEILIIIVHIIISETSVQAFCGDSKIFHGYVFVRMKHDNCPPQNYLIRMQIGRYIWGSTRD